MNDQLAQIYSYLHGIWQYRWSALVVSWIVALLGWAVVYVLPNTYTSTAVMNIDTESMMQPLLLCALKCARSFSRLDALTTIRRSLALRRRLTLFRSSFSAL